MDFKIPIENHTRLLVPDHNDIPLAITKNEQKFRNASGTVSGIPFSEFRTRVLHRISGLRGMDEGIQQPILMTAHQPGLWHPGILYKNAVAKKYAGKYFLISLNVDSDVTFPVSCKTPFFSNGKFNYIDAVIHPNDEKRIIERVKKPPKQTMDSMFDDMEKNVASLPENTAARGFSRFREIHNEQYDQSDTFSHWLTNCRRTYYPVNELHELDLSVLCGTEEFSFFVRDIIYNCERFFDIYNDCLDRYRKAHGIRYDANPFPNLQRDKDGNPEAPFWLIDNDGIRKPLYAACGQEKAKIIAEGTLSEELSWDDAAQMIGRFQIRPRALCLTMFMRLFASSIFIHGVSGGNYDEVTDSVIREYFGCEPPEYIVATRTEFLPIGVEEAPAERARQLKDEIRNMRFNPDEYVEGKNPLVLEKRAIIARSGKDTSKEEFKRLKEIRLILVKEIEQKIAKKERELEAVELDAAKTERVRRRDFPYFFYPAESLED